MLKTFADLRQHISLGRKLVSIDNVVFLLNYRLTFLMLLTSTILVSSRQYIGDHIRCISQTIPGHVIDTFCFFTSTFTIPRYDNSTQVPHPGVGPMGRAEMEGEELRHHAYYQWVPFVLFGQAIMFYLPHLLWRTLEGGTIRLLVSGLEHGYLALAEKKILSVPSKASYREQVGVVRWAFLSRLDLNRWWGFELMLCEVLNALNVLVQLVFTDAFLGGRFLSLGPAVISRRPEDTDPLDLVFPKVTKCTFQKHGPTGTIQVHDTLCVMALNVINEKIYTFLWFWFIFMAIANTLGLVWRLLTILLFSRSAFMNRWLFDVDRRIDPNDFELVVSRCAYSHWLFLYYLCKNMHITARNQLFADLAAEMRLQRSNGYHLADTLPAGGTPRASGRQLDMMGSEEGPRSRSAGVPVNIDEPDHLSSSPLLLGTPPDHQDRPHRE